jgi:hypothetical protein
MFNFQKTFLMLNSGANIEIWLFILVIGLGSSLLYKLTKYTKIKLFNSVVTSIDTTLRYKFIIRAVCQSYLYLAISSFLNIYKLYWRASWQLWILNIGGIIGLGLVTYIPINTFYTLYQK